MEIEEKQAWETLDSEMTNYKSFYETLSKLKS